jgi:putative acetyltransferase
MLVAEYNGEPAGFGRVDITDGEIDLLYVDPSYTGKGIGKALLSFMEELTARQGHKSVYLRSSLNALNFYKHNGYIEVKRVIVHTAIGVELESVIMRKSLEE